jgi:hypothetical protein
MFVTIDFKQPGYCPQSKMSSPVKPRKWYHIKWFQDHDTAEERKLITKLDVLIVPYVFIVRRPFLHLYQSL